jgi:antitoxin (DNA-binding transcriptional repressor) of toxin-antitoxin stability system
MNYDRGKVVGSAHGPDAGGLTSDFGNLWTAIFERLREVMIDGMAQVHMTEAEVTKNFAGVLERLRQGTEVVVEQDHRPVAIISPPKGPGRPIDECIALAKECGSGATLDEDFARTLEDLIAERRPLDASVWD